MGISPIIYDPSLLGFPDFPITNQQVFSSPTSGTNFTVPAGVLWIGAKIWGAGGGGETAQRNGSGGAGSYAEILLEVYPGEILQVRVGGGGSTEGAGGINGGGNGGFGQNGRGGGGGGYSGIFTNNRPLIMTGGGGGGGVFTFFSHTGGSGSDGNSAGAPGSGGRVGFIKTFQGSDGSSGGTGNAGGGGGGGGGFYGGEGKNISSSAAGGGGGSGLSCAVLRDNMRNLIARRVKVFFIFSNRFPTPNGYLGIGNGGIFGSGSAGRVEITYL